MNNAHQYPSTMGIRERREREIESTKRKILQGALRLFIKEGFENVTMRKIAEKAEYSPATLYLYFRNKDAILFALHEEGFDRLYERQQKILSVVDPLQRLREHARVYLDFAREMPEFYDLMFIMEGPIREIQLRREWNAGDRSFNFLRENIRDCMESGYFPGRDLETLSFFMWALVHGIASLIVRKRVALLPRHEMESMIDEGLDFFVLKGGRM